MDGTKVPQYLDEPERILIFTPDEFIVCTCVFVGFVLAWKPFIGIIATFLLYQLYTKAKAGLSAQRVWARAYWFIPVSVMSMKRSPDSVIREWVG